MGDIVPKQNQLNNRIANLGGKREGAGRKPGTPNKVGKTLKDAILEAAERAGGKEGLVGYLQQQANKNPPAFLALIGKVLPMQITGLDGEAIQHNMNVLVTFDSSKPKFDNAAE